MKTDTRSPDTAKGKAQREALASSEKKASQQQPGSYKDKETAEKVVAIAPAGPGKTSIRGLDPK